MTLRVRRSHVFIGLGVAAAYVAAAQLGFRVALVAEQVTTVWAPTGIAQAALLLWSVHLWPAVWVAAFVANATTAAPLWTAASIATGNTLEAVTAAWILSRVIGFDPSLRRARDVVAFILVAAAGSTVISATWGVTTLCAAGVQTWSRYWPLWSDWMLGDALGSLVVAPALLTSFRRPWSVRRAQLLEAALVMLVMLVVTEAVFGEFLTATEGARPLGFVVFPFVLVAAVRLGQPATALVVLVASALTIWHTVQGSGPFDAGSVHQSLVLLQVFLAVLATSGLLLAAAITERRVADERRAAAYAVGQALTNAVGLEAAAPRILEAVCMHLGWQVGGLWTLDADRQRLRCLSVWTNADHVAPFTRMTREIEFPPGIGLPGRVWSVGEPSWIEDVTQDPNFPRRAAARESGLHGAFGFPIRVGSDVLGVVEFFRRNVAPPDADMLVAMASVGSQIGQFIARTRAEQGLRESEARTRAILETTMDAVISLDHRGVITEFNVAAERMFGHPREHAVGTELASLVIPLRLRDRHRQGLKRVLDQGAGRVVSRRFETTAVHRDGHEFPVEVSITTVATESRPMFTGFVRDVTERAIAERERQQLLESERTARQHAELANRAKDEFLATLSHELRTPLNAILGWTRMLLDGAVEPAQVRRTLRVIDRNAQAQVQLVADLLDVSRIITGGLRLDMRPVDLGAVIGTSLDAVRPAAEAKQITFGVVLPSSSVVTVGDAARLQQIVWNLLSNATKFTPHGGRVQVELADRGDTICLQVRDSGVGIAPDFLPHVFDRFRQADGSTTRRHSGLGLGLAIVRHLVELHGGTVQAESDGEGLGATFIVTLPKRLTESLQPLSRPAPNTFSSS